MSCCDNCNQGLGCCDGLGNVSIVGGRVVPGTVIDWRGHILWPETGESIRWHSDAEGRIKSILWAHGGFSMVDAGQVSSSIFYQNFPEISVRVTTQVEFAYLADVFSTIEGAIWQAGYRPELINFSVISVPQGTPNVPQISQPGTAGGAISQTGLPNRPSSQSSNECPPGYYDASVFGGYLGLTCKKLPDVADRPSECDWDSLSIGDYIACQLDITPSTGVVVGIGAAIIGVVLLKRIL
jgi:hypothetical protein